MNLFEEIVNESLLLNEINSNNDDIIKKAINNVLRVRITYDDRKDRVISKAKGKKTRYILPVAYGLTKNGKRAVRAYQTNGSTKRGVPKWKLFLLDNIINWSNGKKSFKKYGDSLIKLGLNTTGDMHMTTLYAITPIGKENVPVAKDSNPIDSEPITKVDVTPTTSTVQNPKIVTKSKDFVLPKTKPSTSIDKTLKNDYVVNKVNAPETEPIKKDDIQHGPVDSKPETIQQTVTTEPITKNDIENNSGTNTDNKLTASFKDLMNRMNNVNKYEEEEENKL